MAHTLDEHEREVKKPRLGFMNLRNRDEDEDEDEDDDGSDEDGEAALETISGTQSNPLGFDANDDDGSQLKDIKDRQISSGMGFKMMQKMGWEAGRGLGATFEGRVEPVKVDKKEDSSGLGRSTYEEELHTSSTSRPRLLESQRFAEETPVEREVRLARIAEDERRAKAVAFQRQSFRCEDCDKTYSHAFKYEAHLSSYDHHHRIRLRELHSASQCAGGDIDERLAKEKKREEKEMKRMQSALAKQRGQTVTKTTAETTSVSSELQGPQPASQTSTKSASGSFLASAKPLAFSMGSGSKAASQPPIKIKLAPRQTNLE